MKNLNEDITNLNSENAELTEMIRTAEDQRNELKDKNQKLLEELKAVKTNNE